MRPPKTLKTCLIFLLLVGFCFGQQGIENENWLKGLGTEADAFPYLIHSFKAFTKDDLTNGKRRLNAVRQFTPENHWEGVYYSTVEIGNSKLIWNAKGGFFDFYFYHELKRFNYGTVIDSTSFVDFVSERTSNSNSVRKLPKIRLIKVKFGERRFLVPENRLRDFCEKAAGLRTDFSDFSYYWTKEEDRDNEIFGLPILPSEYKHFLRYPVETKIIKVGGRKIIPNEQSTKEFNFDDIHYPATLNAGKNQNVKVGMDFFVEDLGEWIVITKVFQTKSIGFIRRDFDKNKQEVCRDSEGGSGESIPCKEIKVGMKSKTKANWM